MRSKATLASALFDVGLPGPAAELVEGHLRWMARMDAIAKKARWRFRRVMADLACYVWLVRENMYEAGVGSLYSGIAGDVDFWFLFFVVQTVPPLIRYRLPTRLLADEPYFIDWVPRSVIN